jgi:integrase
MPWDEFRQLNTDLRLTNQRDKSAASAESRLDIAARIINPKTLGDMANKDTLEELQRLLLAGAESRYGPPHPRSRHTVKYHMNAVKAALRWAARKGWLPGVPDIESVKTSKLKHAKGRPLCAEEFERMLAVVPKEVGVDAAPSWKYVLRGLWDSGLRISELMAMSWDDPNQIIPVWKRGALPVLFIPHDLQKNDTEESIPLLPWLESLLLETPESRRSGWVFNPESLQVRLGRRKRHGRPNPEWVGKVICRIGKRAGIIVQPENARRGTGAKFASAHDLRRSCAERLREAGVPWEHVQAVMRHADMETTRRYYAPGNVQKSAAVLRELLAPKPEQPAEGGPESQVTGPASLFRPTPKGVVGQR